MPTEHAAVTITLTRRQEIIPRVPSGKLRIGRLRWVFTVRSTANGEHLAASVRSYLTSEAAETDAVALVSRAPGHLSVARTLRSLLRSQRWWWWYSDLDGRYLGRSSEGYANKQECEEIGDSVTSGQRSYVIVVDA